MLAYLEAVSWGILASHRLFSLEVEKAPEGPMAAVERDLRSQLARTKSLVEALRRRIRAACAEWSLEAHDIASRADRLVDAPYTVADDVLEMLGVSITADACDVWATR